MLITSLSRDEYERMRPKTASGIRMREERQGSMRADVRLLGSEQGSMRPEACLPLLFTIYFVWLSSSLLHSEQGSMRPEACLHFLFTTSLFTTSLGSPLDYFTLSKALPLLLPHQQGSMRADVLLLDSHCFGLVSVLTSWHDRSADHSIRQHTSAYVSIRQHTSAYVSIRQYSGGQTTASAAALVRACFISSRML